MNIWVNSVNWTLKVPSINQWSFCGRRSRFSVVPKHQNTRIISHRRKLVSLVNIWRYSGKTILFNEVMLAYGRSFFCYCRSIALCETVYDGNEIPRKLCWIICLGLSTVVIALRRISAMVFIALLLRIWSMVMRSL